MRAKRRWVSYLIAAVIAVAIAGLVFYYEVSTYGGGTALLFRFASDGFFVPAVLYIGFGLLTAIADAGNFYGLQYLGYAVAYLFSPSSKRLEEKKDYFTWCMEKREKQEEKKKEGAPLKRTLLLTGLICLILSAVFAVICYRI